MKKSLLFTILPLVFLLSLFLNQKDSTTIKTNPAIWDIRAVDTMKSSRDKARSWNTAPDLEEKIDAQMSAIKTMGANYVTIDTPYDNEFLPYLSAWIKGARSHNLHVWFRGNWSAWEGWFDYPKNLVPIQHLQKTDIFIQSHPEFFADGDIFDPCPECENSGNWNQPEDNALFNKFLIDQYLMSKKAFESMGKKVHTNIFSIIGGRAKEVLDEKTIATLDNTVTIDHYVADTATMTEYLDYFAKLKAKIVIGEFGAPIPDINGSMNEDEQAEFVDAIFKELYRYKDTVVGVNYYVLTEGTTSLLNSDLTPRKVAAVVQNYFIPGIVRGQIKNTLGEPIKEATIKTTDGLQKTTSDANGFYEMAIPASSVQIIYDADVYKTKTLNLSLKQNGEYEENIILQPTQSGILYKIKLFFKELYKNAK